MDFLLLEIVRSLGVAMAIGSTTVMIAQWIGANYDQKISNDETHLLSIVRLVNRLSFLIAFIAHVLLVSLEFTYTGGPISTVNHFILALLCIIFITIALRNHQIITVRHNLAAQISTWVCILLFVELVRVVRVDSDAFLFSYVLFAVFTTFLLDRAFKYSQVTHKNKAILTKKKPK